MGLEGTPPKPQPERVVEIGTIGNLRESDGSSKKTKAEPSPDPKCIEIRALTNVRK